MPADPAPDELADDLDHLDWSIARDGRMRDYATDDEPVTVPYEPEDDQPSALGSGAY